MKLNLECIAGCLWRITVLLLPWQTRWFQDGPLVQGFHWEMGRLAIYASWIPLLATVCLAQYLDKTIPKKRKEFLGAALLMLASFFTLSPRATFQWWLQVILLALFIRALFQLRVSIWNFVSWVVYSLLPHAVLGLEQYVTQTVQGSKWLGIAAQNPLTPGVSVVETGGRRLLRAYGGFPHPNIFGGWLAMALPLTVWLAQEQRKKALIWIASGVFFSIILVLTFSRSAWVAAGFGLAVSAYFLLRQPKNGSKPYSWLAVMAMVFCFGTVAFHESDFVASRFQTASRLEAKSLDERSGSLRAGLNTFLHHPIFGTGPNASLFAEESAPVPIHMVPLLALSEVGLVGMAGCILLFFSLRKRFHPSRVWLAPAAVLVVLLFFDHYLWSLWGGQVLVGLMLSLIALSRLDVSPESVTLSVRSFDGRTR